MTPLEVHFPSWTRSVLFHDQAIKWTKAKERVYSDSVLCVKQLNERKAIAKWEGQVEELKMYPYYKDLLGIDGAAIAFKLNIFQGFPSLQIFQDLKKERNPNLKSSRPGSSSCQCSTTLIGRKKGKDDICISNVEQSKIMR